MLEIRNLTKVYKSKGGAEVRALDGVSLCFEEKGMVFLLGKSGSGKSTLLNLCGGLDSPDSGEIVIKGRSSKEFTQSDFDSYRNTFVGFVFQEYNILNEFSVEDNIALALELQGKNKDKKRVREILEQVEMQDFARRKPNTLSGGQKQRIAIARALVKNPEIIMADEPTGALDSNTGKQVFDTLKKLSENKLVIVVSHDREFAEIYGDRIIELKDGKVISDVSKEKIAPVADGENITYVGNDTVFVKRGADLSDADMEKIRRFLRSAEEDVVISGGKAEVAEFRKVARIDENGARETFGATDESKIEKKRYTAAESKFIRSRLPARHALRIGANSMRVKPFRLIFTIFLSFIAFTMFGLFSTLMFYDEKSVALESYLLEDYDTLAFEKYYRFRWVNGSSEGETIGSETSSKTMFTKDDALSYASRFGGAAALFNYGGESSGRTYRFENVKAGETSVYYGTPQITYFAEVEGRSPWQLLTPETDLSSLGENDIVISSFLFGVIAEYGLTDQSGALGKYSDAVGKTLQIKEPNTGKTLTLTVKGVYENAPPEKYDVLKTDASDMGLANDYMYIALASGIYNTVLVSEGFYAAHEKEFLSQEYEQIDYGFTYLSDQMRVGEENDLINGWVARVQKLTADTAQKPEIYFYGEEKSALADGEIVPAFSQLQRYYNDLVEKEYQNMQEAEDYEGAEEYYKEADKLLNFLAGGVYYENKEIDGVWVSESVYPTAAEYAAAFEMIAALDEKYGDWDKNIDLYFSSVDQLYSSFTVVGFMYGANAYGNGDSAYFSAEDYAALLSATNSKENAYYSYEDTKYVKPKDAVYGMIVAACPDRAGLKSIIDGEKAVNETDDTFYQLNSEISYSLYLINDTIGLLETVFLWVGVVMAAFSMLLLFNFISVSIANKKREIGILRAVGARSTDVFKIFFSESAIITLICLALSFIASFVVCNVLNRMLAEGLRVAVFVFGPYSWLIMVGIALVTSLIATFLPVYGIAKKKPVESIRSL